MYKWSPYYRRRYYNSKWSPYYKYSSYRWSPFNSRYYKWSPHYYRYLTDRYYSYRWSPYYRRYYFDDLYLDLKSKMDLFKSFLDTIPKNRSEAVNELEIPADVLKNRPYVRDIADIDDELSSIGSASSVCTIDDLRERVRSSLSTDSSISLSRAMTCSEIDYDLCRRIKRYRRGSDPLNGMRAALEAFPEEYLVSLNNFMKPSEEEPFRKHERPLYNPKLARKMTQLYEECRPFSPDDPALLDLEEALQSVDLKSLDLELI